MEAGVRHDVGDMTKETHLFGGQETRREIRTDCFQNSLQEQVPTMELCSTRPSLQSCTLLHLTIALQAGVGDKPSMHGHFEKSKI